MFDSTGAQELTTSQSSRQHPFPRQLRGVAPVFFERGSVKNLAFQSGVIARGDQRFLEWVTVAPAPSDEIRQRPRRPGGVAELLHLFGSHEVS